MNILKYSISLTILLKCVIASESGVKGDVIEALKEEGFESIKRDLGIVEIIAMIYLIMWLRRVSSSLLDSSIKLRDAKNPHLLHCSSRDLI